MYWASAVFILILQKPMSVSPRSLYFVQSTEKPVGILSAPLECTAYTVTHSI